MNNSRLINNNCSNNQNGIDVYHSNNITIFENILNDNNNNGIYAQEINYVNITANFVNDNDDGIKVDLCKNSYLIENIANGNSENGIKLEESINNTISGNNVNGNYDGVYLYYADFNTINDNTANYNNRAGIFLEESEHNTIIENSAIGNRNGIFLEDENYNNNITGNIFNNNENGLKIYESNFNSIIGNTANGNSEYGISLEYSNNNTLSGNTANDNEHGIYFAEECEYNTVTENVLYNNTLGIHLESSNNYNSLYKNFFLENGKHAEDDGIDNKWNSTTIGNYWDNWTSPDISPIDGIVDVPYTFISGSAGSIDYLPIAEDGAPKITINSPSSGSVFGVSAPSFDVTITDVYLDSMWYSLDGGLHNYTFTVNGKINQSAWALLPEGSVTITFYAKDILGNESFESVIVTKSIINPGMIITIIVVSIVSGVALIGVGYIYFKKRQNPDRISV